MDSSRVTSSRTRRLAGAGLVIAALSIPVQIAGGADYPTVPPGLVILLAAAALVLFVPRWWGLIPATVVTAFISFGGVVAPNFRHQLADPGASVTFAGSLLQVVGLVVALVSCAAAIVEAARAVRWRP
jgi:hypothetical protein